MSVDPAGQVRESGERRTDCNCGTGQRLVRAGAMINLPEGLTEFVEQSGWDDASVEPIPGDASFRRYFRLRGPSGETAMLMHAPPPHEDPQPFILVAQWL